MKAWNTPLIITLDIKITQNGVGPDGDEAIPTDTLSF